MNIKNILAISRLKILILYKNLTLIIIPIISLGSLIFLKMIVPSEMNEVNPYFIFKITLGFNIAMSGIMMGAYLIAEEKEHNTLDVLLRSSITNIEYFIGSLIPTLIIIMVTNIIMILYTLGFSLNVFYIEVVTFSFVSTLISIFIGFIIGVISKNQSEAGVIALIPILILIQVPIFATYKAEMKKIADYLYVAPLNNLIETGVPINSLAHTTVIWTFWIVVLSFIFAYCYSKNLKKK